MNWILKELLNKFCIVYINNITIYSDNIEYHLEHLRQIFEALTMLDSNLILINVYSFKVKLTYWDTKLPKFRIGL